MIKGITRGQRFRVFEMDNFTCQYCGAKTPDVKLEIDHIIPILRSGDDSMENLITACYDCNRGKRGRVLINDTLINTRKQRLEGYLVSLAMANPPVDSRITTAWRSAASKQEKFRMKLTHFVNDNGGCEIIAEKSGIKLATLKRWLDWERTPDSLSPTSIRRLVEATKGIITEEDCCRWWSSSLESS